MHLIKVQVHVSALPEDTEKKERDIVNLIEVKVCVDEEVAI